MTKKMWGDAICWTCAIIFAVMWWPIIIIYLLIWGISIRAKNQ